MNERRARRPVIRRETGSRGPLTTGAFAPIIAEHFPIVTAVSSPRVTGMAPPDPGCPSPAGSPADPGTDVHESCARIIDERPRPGNSELPRAGRVGGGPADPFPSRPIEGTQARSGNGSPVIGQQGLVVSGPSPIRSARDATRSIAGERSFDIDQTSASLRGACAVAAVLESSYPPEARRMLFRAWLRLRNVDDDHWVDFAAYLPLDQDMYFDLAEDFWFGEDDYWAARQRVAEAILRWRHRPQIKRVAQERCLRWLGLWHPEQHLSDDSQEASRQRQVINDKLDHLKQPGCRLPKRLVSEVPTSNGPGIARLALLLISQEPRLPHVRGFVAWALSRAIVGYPEEADEVAWCLRMNEYDPLETEAAILADVETLIEDDSPVALQAARYLLSTCGTENSAARLATLPTRERRFWLDRPVEIDPLDPNAQAPATLDAATMRLAILDPHSLCRGISLTIEDHELERLEPLLARFAPRALAEFYRRLLQTARQRTGIELRQLGWLVPKPFMLISPAEMLALDQGRRSLFTKLGSPDAERNAAITEAYLLTGLLSVATTEHQLDLLLDPPESALDLLIFEAVISPVDVALANNRLAAAGAETPSHILRRLLWSLSRSKLSFSERARDSVVRCFSHEDPLVRASAFRLAVISDDMPALAVHATSAWSPTNGDTTWESFYGSLALIAGAEPVDYLTLRKRVCPELLGYLAVRDGSDRAINAFAEDLDAVWETMQRSASDSADVIAARFVRPEPLGSSRPELELASIDSLAEAAFRTVRIFGRGPEEADVDKFFGHFDPEKFAEEHRAFQERVHNLIREARAAGRQCFGRPLRGWGLRDLLARKPELTDKWMDPVVHREPTSWDSTEFCRTMCIALGALDPDRSAQVLEYLREVRPSLLLTYKPFNLDSVTWLAFKIQSSPNLEKVRGQIVEEANTDELLFQLALAAQEVGAFQWLENIVRVDLQAPGVRRAARALTLIGFLDEGPLLGSLQHHLEHRIGFLGDVANWAEERLRRNRWARAWFTRFLQSRDPVDAWAAFRLFMRCVDRRFYLWADQLRKRAIDLPILWDKQVAVNEQDISKAAEKNEGRLSDTLFGFRISKDEIAPWYPTPAAVDS
jgi:hypothetical protein